MADAGYYAIESLRLEKGYRAFGRELTPDYSPVEAGLLFATKLRSGHDFLGRAALEQRRARRSRPVGHAAGWSRSCWRTRSRCSGAASWCCTTEGRPGR